MAYGRGWQERTMYDGKYQPIADLLKAGTHTLEAWGNSKQGWYPHLVRNGSGIDVGPCFDPQCGDRLRDLKAAAGRVYGIDPSSVKLGRNWW
jgi:hypothetical protein